MLILLVLAASPVLAQGPEYRPYREREDVHLRDNCRLAAQVIETAQPAPHKEGTAVHRVL